ncbi:MAG: flagellin lysine-N-methylase [Ruminococcus sp.]|nr:flagellin lysine-N-methylase [Ruminococcus sp.]
MKYVKPSYYWDFTCKAQACQDNCCRVGWRIAVDEQSYCSLSDHHEPIFKKLCSAIKLDDEGYYINGGECPALSEDGLCEIAKNYGDEELGYICRMHPRFINEYSDRTEYGLGLACEEAARLIMFDVCTVYRCIDSGDGEGETDEKAERLIELRESLMHFITCNGALNDKIAGMLMYIQRIAPLYANEEYESAESVKLQEIKLTKNAEPQNVAELTEVFKGLEILDEKWPKALDKARVNSKSTAFDGNLKRIFNYFLYRYFVSYSLDGDMMGAVKLAAVSVILLRLLFMDKNKYRRINLAHMYSKEVEYNEENLENLLFEFYTNEIFETENIIKALAN